MSLKFEKKSENNTPCKTGFALNIVSWNTQNAASNGVEIEVKVLSTEEKIDIALKKPVISETTFVEADSYLNVIRDLVVKERARLRQQNHIDSQLALIALHMHSETSAHFYKRKTVFRDEGKHLDVNVCDKLTLTKKLS